MTYDFDTVIDRWNTRSAKWDGMESRYGTKDAIPMWVADMDFMSPPEVVQALEERARHGLFGYTTRPDSYFEAIIDWIKNRHGFQIQKEWIGHSPGVVSGLGFIVEALTQPGDKIIIQTPVYYPFRMVSESAGCEIVENDLLYENGQYTMDFDDLEAKAAAGAKMLILCSPHNPVGRVWTKEELTRLGEICLKHNVLVVSDEIHGDLIYKEYKHIPFGSLSPEFSQKSITCIAPSKTFNLAGLQTSTMIIADKEIQEKVNQTMMKHFAFGANAFGVVALEAAYRHGGPWLDALMDYLKENLKVMTEFIEQRIPSIKVVQPEGTYLVWLDCTELGMEAKELDDFMLRRARLALDEGHIFGKNGEGFQRINIACPRSLLMTGLQQLEQAVQELQFAKSES